MLERHSLCLGRLFTVWGNHQILKEDILCLKWVEMSTWLWRYRGVAEERDEGLGGDVSHFKSRLKAGLQWDFSKSVNTTEKPKEEMEFKVRQKVNEAWRRKWARFCLKVDFGTGEMAKWVKTLTTWAGWCERDPWNPCKRRRREQTSQSFVPWSPQGYTGINMDTHTYTSNT